MLALDAVATPKSFNILCGHCRNPGTIPASGELVGGDCTVVDQVDTYYVQELADGLYQLHAPDYSYDQVFNLYAA